MIVDDQVNSDDTFNLILTIDVDSDFFDSSLSSGTNSELQWEGIKKGIPLLIDILKKYRDSWGNPFKITWFVRVDNQIKTVYGDSAYLLTKYNDLWKKRLEKGDEIGWHPHLYRRFENKWVQETRQIHISKILKDSHTAMIKEGFSPISSRIGEAFQSNEIMLKLCKMGIKIDSTAMPGRVRIDGDRCIDWSGTPQNPYNPSNTDYRLSAKGNDTINILEVPMSMIETKTDYDKVSLKRYVDLSFKNSIIKDGLEDYIRDNNYLVSITHPSTVFPLSEKKHCLIAFDISEVEKNLNTIISECEKTGKKIRSLTLSEFSGHQ